MVRADVYRYYGASGAMKTLRLFLLDRGFRPILTLRLYHALPQGVVRTLAYPFLWLAHRLFSQLAGVDLPMTTRIGPGLMIAHSWGIVLTEGARIGANVTLFHGVTIGRGDQIGPDGSRRTVYPVIEDQVWIGPHAVVVGGVTIGAGSRIMAGCVVTGDVPPRSMVAGNPGQIVRADCTPDVMNPYGPALIARAQAAA